VFSRNLLLATTSAACLLGGAALWWKNHQRTAAPAAVLHLGLAPVENQTGNPDLDWLPRLAPLALTRQLEPIARGGLILATSPQEATARGASHLLYGFLGLDKGQPVLHLTLEETASHARLWTKLLPAQGEQALPALAAAAQAVSASVYSSAKTAPLELGNLEAARLLGAAQPSSAAAVAAAPQCGWCWLAFVESATSPETGLAYVAMAKEKGKDLSPLTRAKLDLTEALLRKDSAARIQALNRLLPLLPLDATLRNQLAELQVNARAYPQGIAHFEASLALDPNQPSAWNSLAYAFAYAGRFQDAERAIARYAQLDQGPNPPDSRGEILLMGGHFAQAAEAFVQSFDKDQNFNAGAALEKAALCHWLNGDKKLAGETIERFLQTRAKTGDAWTEIHRARWEELFGQPAQARQRLAAVAADAKHPLASVAASLAAVRATAAGDSAEARRFSAQARTLARSPLHLFFVAYALTATGESLSLNDPALRLETQAFAASAQGNWQAAAALWPQLLERTGPANEAPARELLALSLVLDKRPKEAQVPNRWPLLTREQSLLYDFLLYPNLFYARAEAAAAQGKASDAQRFYDLYLQYAAGRPDRFHQAERAKSASRL